MAEARIVLSAEDKTGAAIASARAGLQSIRPHVEAATLALLGFSTVAGAAAAALAAFSVSVRSIDSFNDLADASGASIENISALDRVARETGADFDTISTSLVKFNAALKTTDGENSGAAAALKAIGLSAKDLKADDPAEALRKTAVALSGFADDGNKARLVQELFGKSLKEVAPFLKDLGEQGTLVAKVTTEQAQAVEDFNKQLFKLKANSDDAARSLSADLVTGINAAAKAYRESGFFDGIKTLFAGDDQYQSNVKLVDLTEKKFALEKDIADLKKSGSALDLAQLRFSQEQLRTLDQQIASEQEKRKKVDLPVQQPDRPSVKFAGPDKDKIAKAIDLSKQQDSAVQGLSEKLADLTGNTTEYDKVVQRLSTGTWKDFDANTKVALETIARVIDETQIATNYEKVVQAARDANSDAARKTQLEYAQSAVEAMLAVTDYTNAIEEQNKQYAFEISLLGKSEDARKIAQADYQIELELKNQILAVDKAIGLSEEQRDSERKRLTDASEQAKNNVRTYVSTQSSRKENPFSGLQDGLQEYQKSVADVASSTKALMVDAFKGMEDALVDFVKNGKLDFSNLADSIINDLIRIEVRKNITGPLASSLDSSGGVSGIFKSFFSSFDGGGYTGSAPRSGGLDGKGGFLAVMHPQESVFDHTRGQGPAQESPVVHVTQHFTVGDVASISLVQAAVANSERRIAAALGRNLTYGGAAA